jgi:hypothetical protein
MKIIITIVLALFLSSNAMAEMTIKDICLLTKQGIFNMQEMKFDELGFLATVGNTEKDKMIRKTASENLDTINKAQIDNAKLYHYLDCREELKGDG